MTQDVHRMNATNRPTAMVSNNAPKYQNQILLCSF